MGEQLKAAREQQGRSVQEIAEATKIKSEHIRRLEEGHYEEFSAAVYIRGFVRSVAQELKLDIDEILAALDAELSKHKAFRAPPSLTGQTGVLDSILLQLANIPWRYVGPLLALVVVAILGFILYQSSGEDRNLDQLEGLGPGVYESQHQGDSQEETLSVPSNQSSP